MTVDMLVNVALVIFIKSNLAILYMSNIGYVMCHVFALSAFLLLRRDRPNWPRPIKIAAGWLPIAAALCVMNAVFLVVGALAPKLNGYGTWTDFGIGVGVLVASLLLFFYRRTVQDGESIHWREQVPTMPDDSELALIGSPAPTPQVASGILLG
jgi:amino acid transporter